MNNKTRLLVLTVFSVLALSFVTGLASANVLASWALTNASQGTPTTASNVIAGTFVGSGISFSYDSVGARGTSWPLNTSVPIARDDGKYFQITIQPASGNSLTIQKIDFQHLRSASGISAYDILYSKDGFANSNSIVSGVSVEDDDNVAHDGTVSGLNIIVNNGESLTIRFYGYGAESSAGTWKILSNTLAVEGTVTPSSGGTNNPALTVSKTQELTRTQNGKISVQNTGDVTLNNINLVSTGAFSATFSPTTISSLAPGASTTVTVIGNLNNLIFGDNTISVKATSLFNSNTITSNSVDFSISSGFCKGGSIGNLSITKFSISNLGEGKKDEWNLLDTIQIDTKVENIADSGTVDSVILKLGIFDSSGRNVVNNFDFSNSDEESISIGDLSDGDRDEETFTFKIPADVDTGSYKVVLKAYSEGKELVQCTDDGDGVAYKSIDVKRKSDSDKYILFDNMITSPSEATCGDIVSLTTDLYNVGNKDQDQVRVNLRNSELKVDSSVEVRGNVDQGDKATVRFEFNVPQNAQNKVYTLLLSSDYDYRSGSYRQHSGQDTAVNLKVLGCASNNASNNNNNNGGSNNGPAAAISASLGSSAVAGQPLSVKTTITNVGTTTMSYALDVSGYESWAELDSISQRAFSVAPGQSKDVTIKFRVNADAAEQQSFMIETLANGRTDSREVEVQIQPKASTGFSFGDNTYLWIIGAVNVILIILIIVVAVRISRR